MLEMSSYKKLIVWQKSMELVKAIYVITSDLPQHERYGLASQMQRAAVAIPSNIAEGYMRGHQKEYIQFLSVAVGSAAELETQLEIYAGVYGLNLDSVTISKDLNGEVIRMLLSLIRKMRNQISSIKSSTHAD